MYLANDDHLCAVCKSPRVGSKCFNRQSLGEGQYKHALMHPRVAGPQPSLLIAGGGKGLRQGELLDITLPWRGSENEYTFVHTI